MAKNKTSRQWVHDHINDPYVKQAQAQGFRSRAAFKLMQIDDKDRLLGPGKVVVDLGSTPGGWSQVASKKVGAAGRVVAIDLLPMEPVHGVHFILGDFREDEPLAELVESLEGRRVTLFCPIWPPTSPESRSPIRRDPYICSNWRSNSHANTSRAAVTCS